MIENSFEKAFERLEEILESMNENKVSLDDSLKLFEEANNLMQICSKKLTDAEQKIEILLKNREKNLDLNENTPKTENFNLDKNQIL
jgi:exodeoxyribonuclease VII small subunit